MSTVLNNDNPDTRQISPLSLQGQGKSIQLNAEGSRYSINLKNQIKRQKEWVYLSHYLAISG